jgi:hypothetical protein
MSIEQSVRSIGFDDRQTYPGGVVAVLAQSSTDQTQRGAYSLLLVLSGVALGVSGLPAPLYGMYEEKWHLSPLSTTLVFAVYAIAALGAGCSGSPTAWRC